MLLIDTHINVKKRLPYLSLFDLVLLVNKHQKKELLKYNPNIEWFTYGGDTDVFFKLPQLKKIHDVTFNGNIIPWVHYHRFLLLTYLKVVGIKVFYSKDRYPKHNKLFNTSKIILNRTPMGGWNLRVFEVLSSGSLLLSDRPSNGMEKIFIDKTHLVYYDSLSDLKTKIQYYLTHNEEREQIASQGYKFVRGNYSWDIQIKKMLVIFNNFHFKKFKRAPYYFSLFELECFSFRNKALAMLCLKESYIKKEIKKIQYMYYWSLCSFYLSTTTVLINLLNILRTRIILNSLSK
jgi:hypothetical protein